MSNEPEHVPTAIEWAAMQWARPRIAEVFAQCDGLSKIGREPCRVLIPRRFAEACGTAEMPALLAGLPVFPGDVDEPVVEAEDQ